ncbi:type III secretion system inner membrane ring lipoprotein SctJ [Parasulfitobacter algicola]|uniref:Lipoprotein n=1 Tax=Parasulfitobacter algicola TaxID=2614809 RepID=A0ABX2IV32_9RHOB|nr:type III secretion inner membrane ring lipoprotein SctJ [Sulfitobacter algicola]NSX56764.1 type III secretion inner membrane ring lipoprotein SctJ [Sulfitobacter algicola]
MYSLRNFLCSAALITCLAGCQTDLYTDLSEQEANEIISTLYRHQINAKRVATKTGSITVQVDNSHFADAVEVLRANGLPRADYATLGEIFKGEGFIVSPTEERARFVFAMTEELSRTISDIDGVISARTHVVLPTSDRFSRDQKASSASVFIRHDQDIDLQPLVPQIKMLIANSIEGLKYDKVSIVMVPVDTAEKFPVTPVQPPAMSVPKAILVGALMALFIPAMGLIGWFGIRTRRSSHGFVIKPADQGSL